MAYKLAGLVPGSLSLVLADHLPWQQVFLVTALFMAPGLVMTLMVKEPVTAAGAPRTLRDAVIEPFREFFGRHGVRSALVVLGFIFLYKLVPLYLVTSLEKWFPALAGRFAFNVVDGLIRLAIFLGFLYVVSLMKDIRRVFEYHGAEHKVVFNFESGKPVNVANAQTFTTYHPRCGTSFLLVVMLISMVVYMTIPFSGFLAKFVSRIVLLPVIAGLSYELIRFAAKRRGSVLALLTAPGLWLQCRDSGV